MLNSNTALVAALILSVFSLVYKVLVDRAVKAGIVSRERTIQSYAFRWKVIVFTAGIFWLLALVEVVRS